MDEQIAIVLDDDRQDFEPGETLSGRFWLGQDAFGKEIQRIEVSVAWRTEGKGDEDLGVHHFEELKADETGPIDPSIEHQFETQLPFSPLSYDGQLIKIHWRALVRVHFRGKEQWVGEIPFWLGNVQWPPDIEETQYGAQAEQ